MTRRRFFGGKEEPLPEITYVKDRYIDATGAVTGGSGWYYTVAMPIHAGDKVTHKGYVGAATSAIFVYNVDNSTRTNKVTGSGSTQYKTYTWTANTDCYVGFSAKFGATLPKFYLNDVELVITNP